MRALVLSAALTVFAPFVVAAAPYWGGGPTPRVPASDECISGDFNGDGRTDLACYTYSAGVWQVALSKGSGWNSAYWAGGPTPGLPASSQCLAGDFNADGMADLACNSYSGGSWHMALSTGTAWNTAWWYGPPPGGPASRYCAVGDFNGDGKSDLACHPYSGGDWHMALSTGSGWTSVWWGGGPVLAPYNYMTSQCLVGDYDGDGRSDLACSSYADGVWQMALSTGSGWNSPWWGSGPTSGYPMTCSAGDFNGDGKTDLACYAYYWQMSLSTGAGWAGPWSGGGPTPGYTMTGQCSAGDFDGDRKADLACYSYSVGTWFVTTAGAGWISNTMWGGGPSPSAPMTGQCLPGDFNGDGTADFACSTYSGGNWHMALSTVGGWAVATPDLRVASVSGPATATSGESTTVTLTVSCNVALESWTTTAVVRVYLSSDAKLDASDPQLGEWTTSLAPGQSTTLTENVGVPGFLSMGAYRYVVTVAPVGQVAEANPSDNQAIGNEMTVTDTTPPAITVQGVSDGLVSGAQQLVVCVDVSDPNLNRGTVFATLDGVALVNGCGTAMFEGDHILAVHAEDLAWNVSDKTIHFTLDHTPPVLTAESLFEGQLLAENHAQVVICATDAHSIGSVSVDGKVAALKPDGTYLADVDLVEGPNLLSVTATDVAGNTAAAQLAITCDTAAPTLVVSAPVDGAEVQLTTTVTGTVRDAGPVTVYVAGVAAQVDSNGSFSVALKVPPGPQTLTVAAIDNAGNVATDQRIVSVTYPPLPLSISDPLPGFETNAESVLVRGWVDASHPPITVIVNSLSSTTAQPASDGTFAATVAVPAGSFTISVTATDAAQRYAEAQIRGTRALNGSAACSCDASGHCVLARSSTKYCYDGAGNITARIVAMEGGACDPILLCP
jgi:hypothetical protein